MSRSFKHAIITGGSSGIGLSIAKCLVKQGTHVSLIARDEHKFNQAKQALDEINGPNQHILGISADVTECSAVQEAITTAIGVNGPPDLLITSAGIAEPGYFHELPKDAFTKAMNVNYFGTLYPVLCVSEIMKKEGGGQIVLISSLAGIFGILGYAAYCPSKFAVRGFADVIRAELRPYNITVSIAFPPDTDTPQLHTENKKKPKETYLIAKISKIWSADAVAHAMLHAIHKRKFNIVPGFGNKCLVAFSNFLIPLLRVYMDYVMRSSRK